MDTPAALKMKAQNRRILLSAGAPKRWRPRGNEFVISLRSITVRYGVAIAKQCPRLRAFLAIVLLQSCSRRQMWLLAAAVIVALAFIARLHA